MVHSHDILTEQIEEFLVSLKNLAQICLQTEEEAVYKAEITSTIQVLFSRIRQFPETVKQMSGTDAENTDSSRNELNDIIGCTLILYFKTNSNIDIDYVVKYLSNECDFDDARIVYFARIIRNSQNHFLNPNNNVKHHSFDCYDACAYILRASLEELANRGISNFCREALLGKNKVDHHEILTKIRQTEIYYAKVIPKILQYLSLEMKNHCNNTDQNLIDNHKKRRRNDRI